MVVMVVGIPGAGKSHFARQFADVFHTPLVSFDKIRYQLFSEPQFSRDEELVVAGLMNSQILELYKTQRTFIIDGAVNSRTARTEIERAARKHDYGYLTVWVQTDEDSAMYRSVTRNKRRAGDVYNTPMSEEQFGNMVKRINPPGDKENHVVISGKHTFATQAKVVLQKIVSPREGTITPVARPPRPSAASGKSRPGTGRVVSA